MNTLVVFGLLVAVAAAAPPLTSDRDAVIITSDSDNIGTGPFRSKYETSNGITSETEGQLVGEGTSDEAEEQRGYFTYFEPTGNQIRVDWTAGRNGFQASGSHLPTN